MYFKCDISNITPTQLAVCSAIQTLYHEQSMPCVVLSLEPLTFELKPSLPAMMRERLVVNRVPVVCKDYKAVMEGNTLVVSSESAAEPIKRRKRRASKSNTDIQQGEEASVA